MASLVFVHFFNVFIIIIPLVNIEFKHRIE